MKKNYILIGIVAALVVTVLFVFNVNKSATIHADYPGYESQADMETSADIVIEGKVLNSEVKVINITQTPQSNDPKINPNKDGNVSLEGGDLVYTVSKVKVTEVYKGENVNQGDIIEVKQLGGTLNKITYKAEGKPFKKEKEYLMFLAGFEDGIPYSLLNPIQGSFEKDENKQYVGHSENKIKIDIEALKK